MRKTCKDRPLRHAGCVIMKNNRIIPFDSIDPVAIIPNEPKDSIYGISKMTSSLLNYVCDKVKYHELSFC